MAVTTESRPASSPASSTASRRQKPIDGFQLVIEALKLNGLDTIYGLPGIPITDLTRRAQADGLRVLVVPPRAERRLCRIDRRLPDAKARHLPDGVGTGLPQRPQCAGARHRQLLSDDPDQRLERARDRRPAARRLRRDGPARDRQAGGQGGVPRAACRRHRRRHRARHPRRGVGPPGRRVPRPAGQAVRAEHRCGRRPGLADQGGRSSAQADSRARRGQARARSAQGREEAAHHPRQGRGLCAGRCRHPGAGREDRHPVPADVDGQGPAARHARAVRVGGALVRAARGRRGGADRRAPELAAVARQGQDLGRQGPQGLGRPEVRADRHLAAGSRQQRAHRCAGGRRHRLVRVGAAARHRLGLEQAAGRVAVCGRPRRRTATSPRWPRRWPRTRRR